MKTRHAASLVLGGLVGLLAACVTPDRDRAPQQAESLPGVGGSGETSGDSAGVTDTAGVAGDLRHRHGRPSILVMAPPPTPSVPAPLPPPAPSPQVVVAAPEANTLYVETIKAKQVQAHTIYAHEIKAGRVNARIYRTEKLESRGWYGEIETAVVSASVIYVKELEADLVEADTIFVHKMKASGVSTRKSGSND
ncbi:MAG TPA: hypothetical protein VGL09_07295 [Methylomirabilota bacterium]|jgi:hypothetical protein